MSETGPQDQPDDALVDLLIKQATEGLSPAEQRALDALDSPSASEYLRRNSSGLLPRSVWRAPVPRARVAAGAAGAAGGAGGELSRRHPVAAPTAAGPAAFGGAQGPCCGRSLAVARPRRSGGSLGVVRGRGVSGVGRIRLDAVAAGSAASGRAGHPRGADRRRRARRAAHAGRGAHGAAGGADSRSRSPWAPPRIRPPPA
jgi:hypothetical protein